MTEQEVKTILTLALSPDKSESDKLNALFNIVDHLKGETALRCLMAHYFDEPSLALRSYILNLLAEFSSEVLKKTEAYALFLYQAVSFEIEAELKIKATALFSALPLIDESAERGLCALFLNDLNLDVQRMALGGLSRRPNLTGQTEHDIAQGFLALDQSLVFETLNLGSIFKTEALASMAMTAIENSEILPENGKKALELLSQFPYLPVLYLPRLVQILKAQRLSDFDQQILKLILKQTSWHKDLDWQDLLTFCLSSEAKADLLSLFKSYLSSSALVLEQTQKFLAETPSSFEAVKLLDLLEDADSVDIYLLALTSKHPQVRFKSLNILKKYYSRSARAVMQGWLQAFEKEKIRDLKVLFLNFLRDWKVQDISFILAVFDLALKEKDPELIHIFLQIVSSFPYSADIEAPLRTWSHQLLQNSDLNQTLRFEAISMISLLPEASLSHFKDALLQELNRVRSFTEYQKVFAVLVKIVPMPDDVLLPLLKIIPRFMEEFPHQDLFEVLRVVRDRTQPLNEDIQHELRGLATLTQETWLLNKVSKDSQVGVLGSQILEKLNQYDQVQAIHLIKEGYKSRSLKKSEIRDVFKYALSHPCFYQTVQVLIPILKEAQLLTEDEMNLAMDYWDLYPQDRNTGSLLGTAFSSMYLTDPAVRVGIGERLSAKHFSRWIQFSTNPLPLNASQLDEEEGWLWESLHHDWVVFNTVPAKERKAVLSSLLEKAVAEIQTTTADSGIPLYHYELYVYFILKKLEIENTAFTEQEFELLYRLFQWAEKNSYFLAVRSANLFAKKWDKLFEVSLKKPNFKLLDNTNAFSCIFAFQSRRWIDAIEAERPSFFKPLYFVDLGSWSWALRRPEQLSLPEKIIQKYSDILKSKNSTQVSTVLKFFMTSHYELGSIADYSFPTERHTQRKILKEAMTAHPAVFARTLQSLDEASRKRLTHFMEEQ